MYRPYLGPNTYGEWVPLVSTHWAWSASYGSGPWDVAATEYQIYGRQTNQYPVWNSNVTSDSGAPQLHRAW